MIILRVKHYKIFLEMLNRDKLYVLFCFLRYKDISLQMGKGYREFLLSIDSTDNVLLLVDSKNKTIGKVMSL